MIPVVRRAMAAALGLTVSIAAARSLAAFPVEDPMADLAVTITGPAAIAPGGSVAYRLWVRNLGAIAASGVVVTDTLPSPLTFAAASDGGASIAPRTVRWGLGSLAVGEERSLSLFASVPVTATVGRVVNRAVVASAGADADTGDNVSALGSDLVPVDTRVEIATRAVEARPGSVLTYTVSVANASVVPAEGLLVSVALSPHASWVRDDATSQANGFTRTVSAAGVRWWRDRLPGPASRQVALVARVAEGAPAGATLVTTATIAAVTLDNVPGNNVAAALPLPIRSPDVWVSKTGPAEIAVGATATFALRFGNRGPATAPAARVTDTLPAELAYVDAVPPGTLRGAGVVTWDVGDLPPGEQGLVQLRARLAADASLGRAVTNTVSIGSAARDAAAGDNRAAAVATVAPGPPASLVLSVGEPLTVGGTPGAVRVEVRDASGHPVADGTAVMLGTTLGRVSPESGLTAAGTVTATLEPGTVSGSGTVIARSGSVSAEAPLRVLAGPVATLAVSASPEEAAVGEAVTVRIDARDPYGNLVRDGTPVTMAVDRGSIEPATVATQGGAASAAWVNTRSGAATATASAVGVGGTIRAARTVAFRPGPPGSVTVEAVPAAVPVGEGSSTVTARVVDPFGNPVADGTKVAFAAAGGAVRPADGTTVQGTATTRFSAGPVPGPASVTATAAGRTARMDLELRAADLFLGARLDGPRGRSRDSRTYPGEPLTYTLAIRNRDLATARGLYLAIGLPDALLLRGVQSDATVTPTSDPPPGLMPGIGDGYVDRAWALPDLAEGQALTVTLSGHIDRERDWQAFQTLFARAVITTTTPEASPTDLVQSDQAGVVAADHFVTKALHYGASVVGPGGRLRYDIAFGNKTSGVDGTVRITDTLPSYARFDRWEPAIGTTVHEARPFSPSDRRLVWEVDGPDATSGAIRLWLTVDEDAPAQSVLRNVAAIGATVFDFDPDNNEADDGGVWLAGVNIATGIEAPERAVPGEAVTFRLDVRNEALRDTATNVEVVADPPVGARLVATQPPALLQGDGRLAWRQEALSAGGSLVLDATFEVPESAPPGARIAYRAVATSDQVESYPADNTASAVVRVVAGPPADVGLVAEPEALQACSSEDAVVTASLRDARGHAVPDGTPVQWSATGVGIASRDTASVDGVAAATVQAGRAAGRATVRVRSGDVDAEIGIDLSPGPPIALALTADPRVVPRGGRSRITVGVLDGCGNAVSDGWPIALEAQRGAFEGGAGTVNRPTSDGAARATLRVGTDPGPLRVTARHGPQRAETTLTVAAGFPSTYLPLAAR